MENISHYKNKKEIMKAISEEKPKRNKEFRENRSEAWKNKNNPRWNGGNSEYPNHITFKKMRIKILQRSKGRCEICGKLAKVVHHIDGDKSNHKMNNLIAVCNKCHTNLHRGTNGDYLGGRPTKYSLIYGMRIKEIAKRFGVTTGAVYYWIRNPKKKEWLENKLKSEN